MTGMLLSANNFAVPPVEINFTPSSCKALAKGKIPVLSETESRAV